MKTLNLEEAASLLHMHSTTLKERAKAGEIPGAKIGRAWVFHEDVLDEYLRAEIDRQVQERRGATNDDAGRVNGQRDALTIQRRLRPCRGNRPLPVLPDA